MSSAGQRKALTKSFEAATDKDLQKKLYFALDWVMHCHHDIGQAGTPPTIEEWDAALDNAMEVLKITKRFR